MSTGLRNQHTELRTQVYEETGIALGNGDGSYHVTLDELRAVESIGHVDASVTSANGMVAKAETVDPGGSGENVVEIVVYQSAGSAAEMATVPDGAGVCDIRVVAQGR